MDKSQFTDLNITPRILMGPGPSNVHPRVMNAMLAPTVGHLDPQFQGVMEDVKPLLRYVFQTENSSTLAISGTGSAGMEAAIANTIEPGDRVLVGVKGYFGERMAEMAGRYGGQVDRLTKPWGEVFSPQDIQSALTKNTYKVLCLVHGETSTGVLQPAIKEIVEIAHAHGTMVILDTVASLGGAPVFVDEWKVDVCYSGSQKCLSAPPGLAPITFAPKVREMIARRSTKVTSWYLDLNLLEGYWNTPRGYHHTAPVNLFYSLREACRLVLEEGLEKTIQRHRDNAKYLWDGLAGLDIGLLVPPENRNPALSTALVPPGVDELAVRKRLLAEYNVEISGGFGPLAGKVWRIGQMGFSSRKENLAVLLAALKDILGNIHL